MISVKIGKDEIFKESLYDMQKNNFNYQNQNHQINHNQTFFNQNNVTMINYNSNGNKNLENNIDIIPTFLEKQNKNNLNRDLIIKVNNKKNKLEQIIQTIFDKNDFINYSNNISQIRNDMNKLNNNVQDNNKLDYSNFKNLINLITVLDIEQTSQYLNDIKEEDYLKLFPNQKTEILHYINKNK